MTSEIFYYAFPSAPVDDGKTPPSIAEVGGKALSLMETSANFPVPPGLVLTVAFFEPWREVVFETPAWIEFSKAAADAESGTGDVTKERCDAVRAVCTAENLSLTPSQEEQLEAATNEPVLGSYRADVGIFAVRSSSPEEDLSGPSFAGAYDTTLGVTSAGLHRALVSCFSSMFDHVVVQYKARNGAAVDDPHIAVIVQRQIASDMSGVGFSINPSNNCYDEIVISANFGLGESVVGGTITPDTYVIDRSDGDSDTKIASVQVGEKSSAIWLGKDGGTFEKANEDPTKRVLSDTLILEITHLIMRVEEHRGIDSGPVDIEWAYRQGVLYLLQARPVTAYVPLFPEMVTDRGKEKRLYLDVMVMTQGFSDPLSVLGLDIWRRIVARLKPHMSTDGITGLVWSLHGRQYMNLSNQMKLTGGRAMIDKDLRTYDKSIDRALDSVDLGGDYVPSKVPEGAKGILRKQLAQLWASLPKMIHGLYSGKNSMTEYIRVTEQMMKRCHDDECSVGEGFRDALESFIAEFKESMLEMGGIVAPMISRARLGWMFSGIKEADDLLISLCMDLNGNPTSEMGHAMVRLAAFPEIQETCTSEEFLYKLNKESLSDEFMKAYKEFLNNFGCRGMKEIDVAIPRTYENPGVLFKTLRQINVADNQINNVAERRKAAYEKLLVLSKVIKKEKQFEHHAHIIQSLLGYREHPKYMKFAIVDRMRRHALNIGEAFMNRGRLESVDQIFALNVDQIAEAQANVNLELLPLISANMAPYRRVEQVKNWPMIIDSRGKILRGTRKDAKDEDGTLLGDPISPGSVIGRAKVMNGPYEKPLLSGEILVARFTEPCWTPLFINAAGVIMEVGGPMQHGAIIAREYGIPCVSGLVDATKLIHDGDMVEVDGSAGTIKFVHEEEGDDVYAFYGSITHTGVYKLDYP